MANERHNFPVITLYEASNKNGIYLLGVLNTIAVDLFREGIIISYNLIDIKVRKPTIDDIKFVNVHNTVAFGMVEDRHNWIGKFELVQDGDWYYLERIEE
jgi:lipoprotein signal peptidase